jgi:hypothetical protein
MSLRRTISFVLHISPCRILAKLTNLARWALLAVIFLKAVPKGKFTPAMVYIAA